MARLTTGLIQDIRNGAKSKIVEDCTHVGVGTGNLTPSASDVALGNEILRKERIEVLNLTGSVIISGYFNSAEANGNTLTEAGCFDSISAGNLKTRFLINPLVKTADKELWVDNEIKINVIQEVG